MYFKYTYHILTQIYSYASSMLYEHIDSVPSNHFFTDLKITDVLS